MSGRDILLRRSSQSFVVVIVVVVVVVVVVCVVVVAAVGFVRVGITCSRLRLLAWRKKTHFSARPSQEGLVQTLKPFFANISSLRCVLCIYVHVSIESVRRS